MNGPGLAHLLQCRTLSLWGVGRTNDAASGIASFIAEHGGHKEVLAAAAGLYAANGQFERELALREEQVRREPANPEWWARKGLAELRLTRFELAVATLTKAISLEPAEEQLRLLRAVAQLGAGHLDAARADYEELLKKPGGSQNALFGLGGIAWREGDTNAVMKYYQQFLSNSVAQSPQAAVAARSLETA